jgi:hypothetical protein
MIPELELLEQLDGQAMPFLLMEAAVFNGDRARMLNALLPMTKANEIDVWLNGETVKSWQLAFWLRDPNSAETQSALAKTQLTLAGCAP